MIKEAVAFRRYQNEAAQVLYPVPRQEVAAVEIAFAQHPGHALNRRDVEVEVAVNNANLPIGPSWKYQTAVLTGLPRSHGYWPNLQNIDRGQLRSCFHPLRPTGA